MRITDVDGQPETNDSQPDPQMSTASPPPLELPYSPDERWLRAGVSQQRSHWIPAIAMVFVLGVASLAMLIGTDRFGRSQRSHFAYANAVMDLRTSLATSHLWLEEAITGNDPAELQRASADLREATRLSEILLNGGKSEHGLLVEPPADPEVRRRAQEIRRFLAEWTVMLDERSQKPGAAGKGSAVENHADEMFARFRLITADLAAMVKQRMASDYGNSRRLFFAMLLAWSCIVAAATMGLSHWRLSWKQADATLQRTMDELDSRFAARTRELASLIEQMTLELGERRKMEEVVRESERKLRHLSSRLMVAQEAERSRIAKELHDGLGNLLILVKLRLGQLRKKLGADRPVVREECDALGALIDIVIEDVRRLSRNLRPSVFDDLGLSGALRWLMDSSLNREYAIGGLSFAALDQLFPPDAQVVLFRILQEALTNVEKHADAERASLTIARIGDRIFFVVEDDGKGFDLEAALTRRSRTGGLGLVTMNERARMLGGAFDIWSQHGKGTRVTLDVPVERMNPLDDSLSHRTGR